MRVSVMKLVTCCCVLCCFQSTLAIADNYGAIAYSKASRTWGWSYDYSNRQGAEREALSECKAQGTDCIVVLWFANACGALAVAPDGNYQTAWAADRHAAEGAAMRKCATVSERCVVETWVCTSRGGSGTTDSNACRANIGVQCSAQCGGNMNCHGACVGNNAWRCN